MAFFLHFNIQNSHFKRINYQETIHFFFISTNGCRKFFSPTKKRMTMKHETYMCYSIYIYIYIYIRQSKSPTMVCQSWSLTIIRHEVSIFRYLLSFLNVVYFNKNLVKTATCLSDEPSGKS